MSSRARQDALAARDALELLVNPGSDGGPLDGPLVEPGVHGGGSAAEGTGALDEPSRLRRVVALEEVVLAPGRGLTAVFRCDDGSAAVLEGLTGIRLRSRHHVQGALLDQGALLEAGSAWEEVLGGARYREQAGSHLPAPPAETLRRVVRAYLREVPRQQVPGRRFAREHVDALDDGAVLEQQGWLHVDHELLVTVAGHAAGRLVTVEELGPALRPLGQRKRRLGGAGGSRRYVWALLASAIDDQEPAPPSRTAPAFLPGVAPSVRGSTPGHLPNPRVGHGSSGVSGGPGDRRAASASRPSEPRSAEPRSVEPAEPEQGRSVHLTTASVLVASSQQGVV